MSKELGAVYTPSDVADFLVNWAIQASTDQVLDLGVGEGTFVFASLHQLADLGASKTEAALQIYGTEIDKATYEKFLGLATESGLDFPHIACQDFFQASFPQVDVVIGNPPYVRRRGFPVNQLTKIRNQVIGSNPEIQEKDLSRLTDIYVYFLLHAIKHLRTGGRLAVIVADSWLNVRYGRFLKGYLKKHFHIEQIVNFDRPIFTNAQVKPVLIFATKKAPLLPSTETAFTRVMNGLPVSSLSSLFKSPDIKMKDISTKLVYLNKLDDDQPWGIHFKISEINELLAQKDWLVPLEKIAYTRIGIQTLAKKFFTFTPEQIQHAGIEKQFLKPFAHSIAQFEKNIIDGNTRPNLYIFYCSLSKTELKEAKAPKTLEHIQCGELEKLQVRGSNSIVIGYQNKERIIRANRPYWYDIKSDIERRGCASILIPRLISNRYVALWNKAGYVPGGVTIELIPLVSLQSREQDTLLFLAILNSTFLEVLFRGYAQMYGGGASTVGLSQIKTLLVPDVGKLTIDQQNALISAYLAFLTNGNRKQIDDVVWENWDLSADLFSEAVEDLRMLAEKAKKSV